MSVLDLQPESAVEAARVIKSACLPLPDPIHAPEFGRFFDSLADAKVVLLGEASHGTSEFYRARAAITCNLIEHHSATGGAAARRPRNLSVRGLAMGTNTDIAEVRIDPPGLMGLLGVPVGAAGIVIFVHGSGSGRLSPRNNHVAAALRRAGLATFLLDLLTPSEEADRRNVFDIDLLAARLAQATDWMARNPGTHALVPGYFGASTGAAAALKAAALPGSKVAAIVSRGGRPDLAIEVLPQVKAPTLLLVGSLDGPVIDLNERALDSLVSKKQMILIEGAGHLFEEPGTLDQVVNYAVDWFLVHLDPGAN